MPSYLYAVICHAGSHAEWLPHVDKLILEMHANRTPPTCIQANIYAMARAICPDYDVVRELPSLKHIKGLRTVLALCTKYLAAIQIGNAKEWKQLHTDETSRRQTSIVNIVMGLLTKDDELRTVCLTGSLLCEDGTAESQSKAIIAEFRECGEKLDELRSFLSEMYSDDGDLPALLDLLPIGDDMHPSRMLGGTLEHDTCSTAQLTGEKLADLFLESARERGLREDELKIYQGNCWNHLRNVWLGAVEKYLDKKLQDIMKNDLALIPPHLRVTCNLGELNRQVDKECNVTCNYKKGHGDEYQDYKEEFHPGKRWLPVIRALGGTRQDGSFEAALPIYDQRQDILNFLAKELDISENILQDSLFLALGSMQVIAMLRVASILHLAVVLPTRWLAGNTHTLADCKWGEKSMGKVVDLLHDAMLKVQSDGSLLMDYDFIMNIFSPLRNELPKLDDYLNYYLEEKEGDVVGSSKKEDRVLAIDEALAEVFWPTLDSNRETTELCIELARGIATTILLELEDTSKATHNYLSAVDGKWSQKLLSAEEMEASLGVRANNDPSESGFSTMTEVLSGFGRIDLLSACGIGQTRSNGDWRRDLAPLISGRKRKEKEGATKGETGFWHGLPEKLQNGILALCKRKAAAARSKFKASLKRQRQVKREKKRAEMAKKLAKVEKNHIAVSYLHQQYNSPRCWMTRKEALDEFAKLKTKKAQYKFVKEQILIRYLGLGWTEAYHPWSKGKYVYSPLELLEHLVNTVIPLAKVKEIPAEAPVSLPRRKSHGKLGDASVDLIALDNDREKDEESLRLRAMKERDRLESNGFGDQLMEMQKPTAPIEDIRRGPWRIDICFEYTEEGESILQWCQGKVTKLVKEEKDCIVVECKWDSKFVKRGESRITKEKLKKSDWNPESHTARSWRQDLHHLVKTS